SNPLPWNPTIDASLAAALRQLFTENINRERFADPKSKKLPGFMTSQSDKKIRKAQLEEANERLETVSFVLKTWCRCPLLAIAKDTAIVGADELRNLFSGITTCLLDPSPTIRVPAADALLQLFCPDFVPHWDGSYPEWRAEITPLPPTETTMRLYWRISSQVILSLSRMMLEARTADPALLKLARELLRRRNEYLRVRGPEVAAWGAGVPERLAASVALEVALLVFLCSADTETSGACAHCLGFLCDEANLAGDVGADGADEAGGFPPGEGGVQPAADQSGAGSMLPVVENIAVYRELRALFGGAATASIVVTGQKAQQKRIRRVMRGVRRPTAGNMGAWEEVYRRWRGLSAAVAPRGPGAGANTPGGSSGNAGSGGGSGPGSSGSGGGSAGGGSAGSGSIGAGDDDIGRQKARRPNPQPAVNFAEDKGEWANYTGFLCALGGVCLQASALAQNQQVVVQQERLLLQQAAQSMYAQPGLVPYGSSPNSPATTASQSSGSVLASSGASLQPSDPRPLSRRPSATLLAEEYGSPPSSAPGWTGLVGLQLMSAYSHARATVERFVVELVELMVCDNVVVREAVKEFLGGEMSAELYGILFTHFENIVSRFFDATGEAHCTERNTLFVENAISVLKLILERTDDAPPQPGADLLPAPPASTLQCHRRRLWDAHPHPRPVPQPIRVRMCTLAEIVVEKKEMVGLRQEIRFRNRMVEGLLEWNSEFSLKNIDPTLSAEDAIAQTHKNQKLHRDLDLACMRAMVSLLVGLPLQHTGELLAAADDDSVEGTAEAKGRLFYKYLSFFLKVLQKCKVLETIETSHAAPGTTPNADLQSLLNKSKETVQHLGPLKESTILALSNLLSANIDIGLRYSLSMGYHEDSKTRAAFMQVLTNILGMGAAAEQFAGLGEEALVLHDRYARLVDLVAADPEMGIALALCEVAPVADVDDVAAVLVNVFEGRGNALGLIMKVVQNEVENT
ncbi:hypothetical protein BDK51DRAFT_31775, partial [Blyttiomyces helicus]